ncbi:PTS sugar transporter subunit IIA [Streptococcus uberis]|uniref:PTS sugar transporter subunit IIA n=1 Tax=Streptococcus uberis TaxID=1349 RepID=UPI001FF662E6|nr:PTS sugar transporter subunit IIA [Streptococcus uberis]MCK1228747.1 PTS sugar transporter subunit IIA [Streptococcus uberis]
MGKKLILISHGKFCEALKDSVEMIMGPQEDILTVGLEPSEGAEDFKEKFLNTIQDEREVTVFADLMGGTPCNVASRLILEGTRFDLYAGMSMPMVIGFLNGQLLGETVDYKAYAIDNTHHVNAILSSIETDDDDL